LDMMFDRRLVAAGPAGYHEGINVRLDGGGIPVCIDLELKLHLELLHKGCREAVRGQPAGGCGIREMGVGGCQPPKIDGSQSARPGSRARNRTMSSSMSTKGRLPFMTAFMLPLVRRLCTTNRFRPTGGVINAASTRMMMTMPSQTGSKPSAIMIGAMM